MSDIRAEPVTLQDKPALWNDLQDYIDGMKAFDESVQRVDGVYQYAWFDHYWRDDDRWPFWAVAGGNRAGFGLVRRDEDGAFEMAEFYIRPAYRRGGVGLQFARLLLKRFPGQWHISEYKTNDAAVKFWREVISPYGYSEEEYTGAESGKPRLLQRLTVA